MTMAALRMILEPASPADDGPAADGRRRRSQDSRARIVAAMLDLIHGGMMNPGAEQVAARAGVGLRTVFRHFKDMDSLYSEMSHLIEDEIRAIVSPPLHSNDWKERVVELIHRRAAVFERIAPYKRASDVQRHRSPFLESSHARLVFALREILKGELPAQTDPLRVEALDLLMSFEAWSRLRRDQNLDGQRTVEVIEAAVRKLLE